MEEENIIEEKYNQVVKKSKLSKKTLKHLETLKKYYDIDLENKIITIPLYYKNASDILDLNINSKSTPALNREILNKISDIAHTLPYEFSINIDIKIDNYQGYDKKVLRDSILDAFEIFHFDMVREKGISGIKLIFLIVIGVVIFAWLFYICSKHWFGQSGEPTHDTIHEIIYTIAAVLLWEAVYIIFLPSQSYNGVSYNILKSIEKINLLNKNNKVVISITDEMMYKTWKFETFKEQRSRKFLLINGTILICVGLCKTTDLVEILLTESYEYTILRFVVMLLSILLCLVTGIGAISFYRDKGPFKKLLFLTSLITICFLVFDIISNSLFYDKSSSFPIKQVVISSLALVGAIVFLFAVIRLTINRKKNKF